MDVGLMYFTTTAAMNMTMMMTMIMLLMMFQSDILSNLCCP